MQKRILIRTEPIVSPLFQEKNCKKTYICSVMPDDQNPPNMYNKLIFTILFNILFFSVSTASIKDTYLLPKPRQILFNNQKFPIGKIQLSTPVLAEELDSLFRECGGRIVPKASLNVVVRITDSLPDINLNPEEGYTLSVTRNRIYIQATTSTGVYRAMQTLRQLKNTDNRILQAVQSPIGPLSVSGALCTMSAGVTFP